MPKTLFKLRKPNVTLCLSGDWKTLTPWYRSDRSVARYFDREVQRFIPDNDYHLPIVITTTFIGPFAVIHGYTEKSE